MRTTRTYFSKRLKHLTHNLMNPVVHFELPYDDEARCRKFYEEAFGWGVADWPMEDGTKYIGIMTGEVDENNQHKDKGVIGGGMVPRSMAQQPVLTLKADDVEEVAAKAVEAGAERLSDHTYTGVGKIVYLKDTEGNVISLWEHFKKDA